MLLLFDSIFQLDQDSHTSIETTLIPCVSLAQARTALVQLRSNKAPLYAPNVAAYCKHFLHPGTPQTEILCPTCKVTQRLGDLHAMTTLWERRGGPLCTELSDKDIHYWKVCKAWHTEKAYLVKYVGYLEAWAERERRWEQEHPGALEGTERQIESASKALKLARRNTPYLEWADTDAELEMKRRHNAGFKRVRFREGIVERPKRNREAFWRVSGEYIPGNWAPPEREAYLNTSFVNEVRYGTLEFEKAMDEWWEQEQNEMSCHQSTVLCSEVIASHAADSDAERERSVQGRGDNVFTLTGLSSVWTDRSWQDLSPDAAINASSEI